MVLCDNNEIIRKCKFFSKKALQNLQNSLFCHIIGIGFISYLLCMADTTNEKSFYDLDFNGKKERLAAMLTQLKDSDSVFADLFQILTTKKVEESYLDVLYGDIMNYASAIKAYEKTKDKAQLDKAQTYLQQLHELEEESKKQDAKDIQALDSMLANM